jgi:hypothetical protein
MLLDGRDHLIPGGPLDPHQRDVEPFAGAMGERELTGIGAEHAGRHLRDGAIPLAGSLIASRGDAPEFEI